MGFKSGNKGGRISLLQNCGKWRKHHSEFCLMCEKVVFVELLISACGLYWRRRPVRLHTRVWRLWNGLRLENGPRYLRNTTVPRWMISKEELRGLLRSRRAIVKNKVIDWLLCMFSLILYHFLVIREYFEPLLKQKKSKDFLFTLYTNSQWALLALVSI